jgi:dipeptide/tripeptide permease
MSEIETSETGEQNKILSLLIVYFPILTVIGYCLGTFRLYLYYKFFNLNILPYLDLSDSISQSFNYVFFIGSMAIACLIFTGLILYADQQDSKRHNGNPKKYQRSKKQSIIILLAFAIIFIFQILFIDSKLLTAYMDAIKGISSLITLVALVGLYIHHKQTKSQEDRVLIYFISVIIVMAFFASYGVSDEVLEVKEGEYTGTTITTKNEVIKITNKMLYVGSTNKYVFIFQTDSNKMNIYPIGEIKKMSIIDR